MQTLARDLTITLGDDRPGALATVLDAVAKARINVEGYAESAGTLHLMTSDANATRRALESAGLSVVREEDVVVAELVDRPGVAAGVFRQIADRNINVTFSYLATGNRIVVGSTNIPAVKEVVSKQLATI